ncbi:hypothetical protein LOTGIDRAFT_154410 [Lottia gigantea]|uniref:Protein kinase domain-containing protein n=1 Tax=Lottia gigantea TaxID=225164 RepID=V4A304_LOTGI|nr:hypothetical protein LOTGIDRAFT_154410 [Lottia gigantea]ESO89310.1 hypothetical protein LOTGIDRAFT_154410 [Lottia gigantea]
MSSSLDQILQKDFIETDREKTVGNYRLSSILTSSRFSDVRLGFHLHHGHKVAVKCIKKLGKSRSQKQILLFKAEYKSLISLKHRNIVKMYETMVTADNMYLVLEYIDGKTLSALIKERCGLGEDMSRFLMYQLVTAVSYCHSNYIIHRDIKPSNIMVNRELHVTLIDFGLSCNANQKECMTQSCGTPVYTAPEVYLGIQHSFPRDVWSIGVVLYEMVSGCPPFFDLTTKHKNDIIENIHRKLFFPSHLTQGCQDLLTKTLTICIKDRISIDDMLLHSWFKDVS